MNRSLLLILFAVTLSYSQEYYFYVAAESDDTVSLINFDGETTTEDRENTCWCYENRN